MIIWCRPFLPNYYSSLPTSKQLEEVLRVVCKIIGTYKKECGSNKAEQKIADLKKQHARRPAFLEELAKVK
jgi:hypothetical protein